MPHMNLTTLQNPRIPKGFRPKAQGCEERTTLGSNTLSFRFIALLCLFAAFSAGAAAKKPAKPAPIPPGKPEIFQLEPHGIQRGTTAKIKLIGTNQIGRASCRERM